MKCVSMKNKFGQYFTPRDIVNFMVDLVGKPVDASVLEPSCGEGVFLDVLSERGYKNIDAFEIDESLATQYPFVKYESFISADIRPNYDLIIGNPPYIRWKNLEKELKDELCENDLWNMHFNSLCDYLYIFILRSIELLNEGGELVFICPEYWMSTTHSSTLRDYMMKNGYFEAIYHFNETPIFSGVNVSIVIFKYVKTEDRVRRNQRIRLIRYYNTKKLDQSDLYKIANDEPMEGVESITISQFQVGRRWILQDDELSRKLELFMDSCVCRVQPLALDLLDERNILTIGDVCDIGNGLVSGLDKAFQLKELDVLNEKERESTLKVFKAKNLTPYLPQECTWYINIEVPIEEEDLQTQYPNFYSQLFKYKDKLLERYQYNKDIKYWEWVFKRNYQLFKRGGRRIFVPCKERVSNKGFFRFALVEDSYFPTQDVTALLKKPTTRESIEYIVAYLNMPIVFDWLKNYGIIKGHIVEFSEKPIASIPFKGIDWNNVDEVRLHDGITQKVNELLESKNMSLVNSINEDLNKLLNI